MTTADFGTAQWRTSSRSGDSGNCVEVAFADTWRTSSRSASGSGSNCVQVGFTDTTWRKSTRSSSDGSCVEVAHTGLVAGLRDSKNPAGGLLAVNAAAFARLVHTARGR